MLDVSDTVRAEIGEEEAERLLAGENAPGAYDCTSCRTPGDTGKERTSTVLFVGGETAVLAFAHAGCVPSQVVTVSEEQLQGAVRTITGDVAPRIPGPADGEAPVVPAAPETSTVPADRQAVLGITCGQILVDDTLFPALVVEPTGPIVRPGSDGTDDEFLTLLVEHGFAPVPNVAQPPQPLQGWSVLMATGKLHAILQPAQAGGNRPTAWWQAHQALAVTDGWRSAVNKTQTVLVYCAPAGTIGQQPREDLMREALEQAASAGLLVAAAMPLAGA